MDFIDQIQALSARIPKQLAHIQTEEATKSALVMPFIQILGYNIFDPSEVIPEFTADVGVKKREKVDYAIMKDDKPIMLFECKKIKSDLEKEHKSQLYRYFSVTDARVGVLTNGIVYKFFSDLDEPNRMDSKAFLEIDLLNIQKNQIAELKKLTKSTFDLDKFLSTASDLKYTKEIKRFLNDQLNQPSDKFVYHLAKQVYSGTITKNVREQFTDLVKGAFHQFINEKINERLESALVSEETTKIDPITTSQQIEEQSSSQNGELDEESKIVTTGEELEGYYIVKAILRNIIPPQRIFMRDTQGYFGVLLDDNNRKPICRMYFNSKNKRVGFFGDDRKEKKITINDLNDLYEHADKLRFSVQYYEVKLDNSNE